MRGGARLHADDAGRQVGEKAQHAIAAQTLGEDNFARRVNAVNLKNRLGKSRPMIVGCMGGLRFQRADPLQVGAFTKSGERPSHQRHPRPDRRFAWC